MFSGIIEEIGVVLARKETGRSLRFTIGAKRILDDIAAGDSISVDGVCLTVEAVSKSDFTVYASPETISRTALVQKRKGGSVNLERALGADGRVGGHFVQGHIDGVGEVLHITRQADSRRFAFRIPQPLLRYCVEKGSIAIDGISLTIASLSNGGNAFVVAVIPYTYQNTTLGKLHIGDRVNVECDIFAKYAERFLNPYTNAGSVNEELLRRAGFIA